MMPLRRLPALAIPVVLAVAAAASAGHGTPIANHEFEVGLAGWTTEGGSGCSHTTEGPVTDKEYRNVDASSSADCGIHQTVAVVPGLYSVYVNAYVNSGVANLRVEWLDASSNVLGSDSDSSTVSSGAETLSFASTTPTGTTQARFIIEAGSTSADFRADSAHLIPF